MKSIEIDIGKRRCIVCTMDRNGIVLEETGCENTYAAATAFARKARGKYGKCQAACESTGNLWIKTYEVFEEDLLNFSDPISEIYQGLHRSASMRRSCSWRRR